MKDEYMLLAIEEAKKAYIEGEVPIGAVIVKNNVILSKTHNLKEKLKCATKHAEILAIEETSSKLNNWRLEDCDLYVTVEPCSMCASAIKQSRIKNVYAGIKSNDLNNNKIINTIFNNNYNNSRVNYYCGYYENEITKIMQKFFEEKRI